MEDLKRERRWCVWKREMRGGSFTKVPYRASAVRGSSSDENTWLTYEAADDLLRQGEFSGLGFYLSCRERDQSLALCVIDIDAHHINGEGNPLAAEILDMFAGTYIEQSPGGKGFHIVCNVRLDSLPMGEHGKLSGLYCMKNSANELEIYIGGMTHRFMTFTGKQVSSGETITDQTENVLTFLDHWMRHPRSQVVSSAARGDGSAVEKLNDRQILQRLDLARCSRRGREFVRLYDEGAWRDAGFPSQSEADMKLVKMLCFWLGPNREAIDKAFRASRLMRPKWDEQRGQATYGERTIDNVLGSAEEFYSPPAVQSAAWVQELASDTSGNGEETATPDQTIDGKPIDAHDVLRMINEIADDPQKQSVISVLPLMCGTGKSTAIRLKMRQIIEANNGDGMIVVTDNIDRMRDYLQPRDDPEMRQFFEDHAHLITVMTSENLSLARKTERVCPILIMTTQRFTKLPKWQIEEYLTWGVDGVRSLILVDEQPYFRTEVSIKEAELKSLEAAVSMGVPRDGIPGQDREELLGFLSYALPYVRKSLNGIAKEFSTPGIHYTFHNQNWKEREKFERFYKLLDKHKIDLNTAVPGEYHDIFSVVRALFAYMMNGALISINHRENDSVVATIHVLLDNHECYTDLDASVIILDGTADLSMAYQLYPDVEIVDCSQYRRDLSKLHIHLVDVSTGKTTLTDSPEQRAKVFDSVRAFMEEHAQGAAYAVFSYKDFLKQLEQIFGRGNVSWFGIIRGTNDFRSRTHIAQIGLNRFPPSSYFLYELAMRPELAECLDWADHTKADQEIQKMLRSHDGITAEAAARELMAELEQNIFRGTIRNSNSTEDYHFFLFISLSSWNKGLLEYLRKRYEVLHAEVTYDGDLVESTPLEKAMRRANSERLICIVRFHDLTLKIGEEYTYKDIAAGTGLTVDQIKKVLENNRELAEYFNRERIQGRKGRFVKRENWQFATILSLDQSM